MPFNQGHALLFGVGTHEFHPGLDVSVTVADAEAVGNVLQDASTCGYPAVQVQIVHDRGATKDGMLSALDEVAARVSSGDTVFLFYCGHGALGTDGNYYLVSHDARIQDGKVVAGTGVSEDELLAKLKAIEAQRMLVVFNACHSGSMSPSLGMGEETLQTSNPSEESSMALLGTGQGRIIIAACRQEQVSYIGLGENTIFTEALVDGLRGRGVRGNNGFISAFSLYEHVYASVSQVVKEQINAVQEPELTVIKGVGPFAVSLYKGATTLGELDTTESLPEGLAVHEVAAAESARIFQQRVIQTGGGAYISGKVSTGGGDVIGRDRIVHGDEVHGDRSGGVRIGNVSGGIHGSIIAGGDVENATITLGGQRVPAAKEPSVAELRQLLAEIQQELAQVTAQQEALRAVSPATATNLQAAAANIQGAAGKVTPDSASSSFEQGPSGFPSGQGADAHKRLTPEEATSVEQWLAESATTLENVLNSAKAVAGRAGEAATVEHARLLANQATVQSLVEKLAPLVEKVGVAALWVAKIWL